MKVNGEAIYNTKPFAPYKQDKIAFTSLTDGTVYVIYLADENETLPRNISLKGIVPTRNAKVDLLGNSTSLQWQRTGDGSRIDLPPGAVRAVNGRFAWVIKISQVEK